MTFWLFALMSYASALTSSESALIQKETTKIQICLDGVKPNCRTLKRKFAQFSGAMKLTAKTLERLKPASSACDLSLSLRLWAGKDSLAGKICAEDCTTEEWKLWTRYLP